MLLEHGLTKFPDFVQTARLGRFPNNGEWIVEALNVSLSYILESDFHINLKSSFMDV